MDIFHKVLVDRLAGKSPALAMAVSGGRPELSREGFALRYSDDDEPSRRLAERARVLIAEELAAMTQAPLPLGISSDESIG